MGYPVALKWIKEPICDDDDEAELTASILRMFLKMHVENDNPYRNLFTKVDNKCINMEFFIENQQE